MEHEHPHLTDATAFSKKSDVIAMENRILHDIYVQLNYLLDWEQSYDSIALGSTGWRSRRTISSPLVLM